MSLLLPLFSQLDLLFYLLPCLFTCIIKTLCHHSLSSYPPYWIVFPLLKMFSWLLIILGYSSSKLLSISYLLLLFNFPLLSPHLHSKQSKLVQYTKCLIFSSNSVPLHIPLQESPLKATGYPLPKFNSNQIPTGHPAHHAALTSIVFLTGSLPKQWFYLIHQLLAQYLA